MPKHPRHHAFKRKKSDISLALYTNSATDPVRQLADEMMLCGGFEKEIKGICLWYQSIETR